MSDFRMVERDFKVWGVRVALVATRFNQPVVDQLVDGARAALLRHGVGEKDVHAVRVPGAWELPLAVAHLVDSDDFDAVVALGCVIRGDTPHFDYVCRAVTDGLRQIQLETGTPIGFGLLTTEDRAQAEERADPERGDKGREAAVAALEMVELIKKLGDRA